MDVPGYKLIIAATLVFVIGLFVFTIIFRAYFTFKQLESQVIASGKYKENEATLAVLGAVPWALGGIYLSLLGTIIYFMLKGSKPPKSGIQFGGFEKYK